MSRPYLLGALLGIVYGVALRQVFVLGGVFTVMLWSFIFIVPFVVGFLTTRRLDAAGLGRLLIAPWGPITVLLLLSLLIGWEGLVCVVFTAPIFYVLSSIGGYAAGRFFRGSTRATFLIASLPLLLAPVEQGIPLPLEMRAVRTSISIEATPDVVWDRIVSIPEITREENHRGFFQRIGFPRPLAATLSGEGVAAVRRATFSGEVLFLEEITEWRPGERLAFAIDAQTERIPRTTLDPHVTIGGEYFDVLEGTYTIEPAGSGVRLVLESRYRLSTHFNPYARLWADAVMRSIQENVLQVIRERAEAGT